MKAPAPVRIALRGPMYSGKTTLALRLEDEHGFHIVRYADYLKELAATALTAAGLTVTPEDIITNKARYRAFLQDLGALLDFDNGFGIDTLLEGHDYGPRVVFDNVRFLPQWERLKPYGFTLVGLTLDPMDQERRAAQLGVSRDQLGRALQHPAEMGFPVQEDELVIPGFWPTATKVDHILRALGVA